MLRRMPPADPRYKEIPPRFHAAFPLDDGLTPPGAAGSYGYPSVVYKVIVMQCNAV